MFAYLIDPVSESVELVQFSGNYKDIYKLLDIGDRPFTVVKINAHNDAVFVDDEGLLNDPEHFFLLANYHQPLAGRGLVLGTTHEGDSVSPKITLAQLKKQVSFARYKVDGFDTSEGEQDTAFGRMHVIRSTPVFTRR